MIERLNYQDNYERAYEFTRTHVLPPLDYDAYVAEQLGAWEATGSQEPLWLRRANEKPFTYPVDIDYVVPEGDKLHRIATIELAENNGTEILTILSPSLQNPQEDVIKHKDRHTFRSLELAINLIEHKTIAA